MKPEMIFECNVCGLLTPHEANYRNHMANKHGVGRAVVPAVASAKSPSTPAASVADASKSETSEVSSVDPVQTPNSLVVDPIVIEPAKSADSPAPAAPAEEEAPQKAEEGDNQKLSPEPGASADGNPDDEEIEQCRCKLTSYSRAHYHCTHTGCQRRALIAFLFYLLQGVRLSRIRSATWWSTIDVTRRKT